MDFSQGYKSWTHDKLRQEIQWRGLECAQSANWRELLETLDDDDNKKSQKYLGKGEKTLKEDLERRGLNGSGTRQEKVARLLENDTKRYVKYRKRDEDDLREELKRRGIHGREDKAELMSLLVDDDLRRECLYMSFDETDLQAEIVQRGMKAAFGGKKALVKQLVVDNMKRESRYHSMTDSQLREEIRGRGLSVGTQREQMVEGLTSDDIQRRYKFTPLTEDEAKQEARKRGLNPPSPWGESKHTFFWQLVDDDLKSQRSKMTEQPTTTEQQKPTPTTEGHDTVRTPKGKSSNLAPKAVAEVQTNKSKKSGLHSYEMLEEMGKGAIGIRYKARRIGGDPRELFVIERIGRKHVLSNQSEYQKLLALHKLEKHVNIVNFLDFFLDPTKPYDYIVREHCPDGNLNDYVINENPPLVTKVGFMIDMARGVEFLHKNEIIHRDLKPENILMAKYQGKVICKIANFGMSKVLQSRAALCNTFVGSVGINSFQAPEVGYGMYTYSADVFSLGLVYMAVYLRYISPRLAKTILPIVIVDGSELEINKLHMQHFGDKSNIIIGSIKESRELGELIDEMLDNVPSMRKELGADFFAELQKILASLGGDAKSQEFPKSNGDNKEEIPNAKELGGKQKEQDMTNHGEHIQVTPDQSTATAESQSKPAVLTSKKLKNLEQEGAEQSLDEPDHQILSKKDLLQKEVGSIRDGGEGFLKPEGDVKRETLVEQPAKGQTDSGIGSGDLVPPGGGGYAMLDAKEKIVAPGTMMEVSDERLEFKTACEHFEHGNVSEVTSTPTKAEKTDKGTEATERVLGRAKDYLIHSKLGHGTYGDVYKATKKNDSSGRTYAIKVINKDTHGSLDYEREFALQKREKHPNVINIYEFFSHPYKPRDFLIMDYCPDGDLNDFIIEKDPSLLTKVGFMIDMAKGVGFLHQNKVIHRDIKPQNVLMAKHEGKLICKITDFGVSKIQLGANVLFSTIVGTKLYVAPEVWSREYSYSADVFSLGLVYIAIYMRKITGSEEKDLLPMVRVGDQNIFINMLLHQIGQEDISDIILKTVKDSKPLGELIDKMLLIDPNGRPSIDAEFISNLQRLKTDIAKEASVKANKSPPGEPIVEQSKYKANEIPLGDAENLQTLYATALEFLPDDKDEKNQEEKTATTIIGQAVAAEEEKAQQEQEMDVSRMPPEWDTERLRFHKVLQDQVTLQKELMSRITDLEEKLKKKSRRFEAAKHPSQTE